MATDEFSPVIQDGVPLPPKAKGRPRSKRWAFLDEMKKGQSAVFQEFSSAEERRAFRKRVGSVISNRYPPTADKAFAVRSVKEGIGIWRTK